MPLQNITRKLPTLWKSHLAVEFEQDYMLRLCNLLIENGKEPISWKV